MNDQPKPIKKKVKYTKLQIVMEVIAFLILLAMIFYPIIVWNKIPEKIPMHYNFAGEVDRWGSKTETIFLPIVGAFLYLLLTAVMCFPSAWNIPVTVTDQNKDKVYGCVRSMLILMKIEIMGCFFYLVYQGIKAQPLSSGFLPVELLLLFGTIIYFIVRMTKISKK